ncbi:hypothetical protein Pfo_014712 [Paulownia fortunei]|nr:hypothetical protein Pfo_014712 [Paulownia fortunei]
MSRNYDNWERLVAAVLRREQLWQLCHSDSINSSFSSLSSDFSSSSSLRKTGENLAFVDWATRLRIAIGAARGIAHLHTQIGGKLVHGNIKASNIFINSQRYGCVSDIGLADVIATTFMPTTHCYAPEVKNTQNVSQASDVYSFGVLLLELLTRKSPVQGTRRHEAVDLVKWVNSVNRKEWIAEVFDIDLLKSRTIKEQTLRMLHLGISCVAKSPKKRPKMSAVVKMIEDISMMNMGNQVSMKTERNKLVFFKDGNDTFNLEDVLRASAVVLGKGTFGTSHKAILENGITIVVKRLREVIVAKKEFQQHIEVIGRILGHKNIAELRAYYYSKDEKLLVYDYYNQDSVSAMLQDTVPLDWKARLKIAVGAARGVAHIHRLDGGKLIHENIRASNIFLNEQQYGRVFDVGLATLLIPITLSVMRTAGYCAPEVTDITKMSQAWKATFCYLEEWNDEVFDVELLRYQHDEEAMVQLLKIAMDCVVSDTEHRPKMADVVRKLEEISEIERVSSPSIESRLEDLFTLTL